MTSLQQINLFIRKSLRSQRRSEATNFVARWQSGVETLSGCGLPKVGFEFAPSTSGAITDLKPREQ